MPFILLALVVVALVSASSAKGAAAGTAEPPALFSPGERAYSRVHGTEVIVGRAAYGALGWKYKALLPCGTTEIVREDRLGRV